VFTFIAVTVTSARTVPQGTRPPHATLVSMDIVYKWRSRNISTVEEIGQSDNTNPFLSPLFLPFQTILNTVVEKFVSVHLVKCVNFLALVSETIDLSLQTLSLHIWPVVQRNSLSVVGRSTLLTLMA
jgi:hypothetical protein